MAGPYNATYNAIAIASPTGSVGFPNSMTTDGFTLTVDSKAELIQQTDQFGDSILDGIYRGGNCFVDFESKTFIQGSMNPFWPYANLGILSTSALPVGRQMSMVASAFVISALGGTPAVPGVNAGAGVAAAYVNLSTPPVGIAPMAIGTLTAPSSCLPPDANHKLLFTSRLRTVPCRLVLLPTVLTGSTVGWFTTS